VLEKRRDAEGGGDADQQSLDPFGPVDAVDSDACLGVALTLGDQAARRHQAVADGHDVACSLAIRLPNVLSKLAVAELLAVPKVLVVGIPDSTGVSRNASSRCRHCRRAPSRTDILVLPSRRGWRAWGSDACLHA
jgi:hypothetical protein